MPVKSELISIVFADTINNGNVKPVEIFKIIHQYSMNSTTY